MKTANLGNIVKTARLAMVLGNRPETVLFSLSGSYFQKKDAAQSTNSRFSTALSQKVRDSSQTILWKGVKTASFRKSKKSVFSVSKTHTL